MLLQRPALSWAHHPLPNPSGPVISCPATRIAGGKAVFGTCAVLASGVTHPSSSGSSILEKAAVVTVVGAGIGCVSVAVLATMTGLGALGAI